MTPINVLAAWRGSPTESLKHHITPLSFELPDRTVKIKQIRRHPTQIIGTHKIFHAQDLGARDY